MRVVGLLMAIVVLSACWSSVPPLPGEPVPFKVVNRSGLPSAGMDVIADSSVEGINGLLLGVSGRNQSLCQYPSAWCWSSADFPVASAAFGVEVYQGCNASDLVGAYLSGTNLSFDVKVTQQQCPPGAGALAEATFQLVAISRSDLPASLIRVHVYYGRVESPRSTLLDLRAPMLEPPSVAARMADVQQAVNLAVLTTHSSSIAELAARRFAEGPITCAPPLASDSVPGYVIVFDGVDGEFDFAAGKLVQCPATNV